MEQIFTTKVYSVGIYARLSVDSNDRKNESIETQIEIVKTFVAGQQDMTIFDCYTDMGKTGTNFHREGFERMMQDVRMHKIDCIIVKDLSRFGRNHIETGNYIEKIFPFMGVRFIAVTDHFDSMNIGEESEMFGMNLKNLVNEMYARDIGMKVRASKKLKREQGSYTGGIPPYGYRAEWIEDKKCLFVEDVTSDIVRNIFQLFLSGKNMREIMEWLYQNKINRPTDYRKTGMIYCEDTDKLQQWSKGTVKSVLRNPVYIGSLIQADFSEKKELHKIKEENVSIHTKTHEAIINEDDFYKAAERFEKNMVFCNQKGYSKTVPVDKNIFAEVLYCGDCGAKMKRISAIREFSTKDKIRTYSYNCSHHDRIDSFQCVTKSIPLHVLEDIVKKTIQQEISLSGMLPKDLLGYHKREAERIKEEWKDKILELQKQIESIQRFGSEQYLKYRMGELSIERFQKVKEENAKKLGNIENEIKNIAEKIQKLEQETKEKSCFLRALVKGSEKIRLTEDVIAVLIYRIEVYAEHRVKIIFHFERNKFLPK